MEKAQSLPNPEQQSPEQQTPYLILGGASGVRRLVDRFYRLMDTDPEFAGLRRLHAQDLSEVRQLLFEFLSGWLGGPPLYFQRKEHRCIMSAHRQVAIGPAEVESWLSCMKQALRECGAQDALLRLIEPAFDRMAGAMKNRPGA